MKSEAIPLPVRFRATVSMERDRPLEREFEDRLAECGTLAFRVAWAVLRHRQDAEEVGQDAIARAYRSFNRLRDRERFRAWLVRITWRLALDRRRADQRRTRRERAVPPPPVPSVEDIASRREFEARLWQAIDGLPDRLRLPLVLSAIEGHDVREVARLLALREGTVKSRLYHARRRLARSLG